jgi:hypothetical protein
VPLHRQAEYLGGRDLGKFAAAHEDGLVFARMDLNRAHEEFYKLTLNGLRTLPETIKLVTSLSLV